MKTKEIPWTQFHDMHSGGGAKEKWGRIYIQAPEDEAAIIFYNRFGHNPHRVTCTCCGNDYSLTESEDLHQATGYERNCHYSDTEKKYIEEKSYGRRSFSSKPYVTLEEYLRDENAHFIFDKDIKPEERTGSLPEQGYAWID